MAGARTGDVRSWCNKGGRHDDNLDDGNNDGINDDHGNGVDVHDDNEGEVDFKDDADDWGNDDDEIDYVSEDNGFMLIIEKVIMGDSKDECHYDFFDKVGWSMLLVMMTLAFALILTISRENAR